MAMEISYSSYGHRVGRAARHRIGSGAVDVFPRNGSTNCWNFLAESAARAGDGTRFDGPSAGTGNCSEPGWESGKEEGPPCSFG